MTQTLLLTGSEGYTGSSPLPRLDGFEIVTVDRVPARHQSNRLLHIQADMARETDTIRTGMPDGVRLDAVIHLAAIAGPETPWDKLYSARAALA